MIMAIFTALIVTETHKDEIGLQYFLRLIEYLAEFTMKGGLWTAQRIRSQVPEMCVKQMLQSLIFVHSLKDENHRCFLHLRHIACFGKINLDSKDDDYNRIKRM
ncbi:MAG: hypothetical protein PHE79_07035 [Eubacteriales bacterium]|nr:hypothetical protein [Eubacteriales bacterium]